MAFTELTDDLAIIAALADLPNATSGLTAAQLKDKFDQAAGLIKTYLNSTHLTELGSTTDGSSGADNIGATAITDLTGTTVQAIMESLRNTLKATTDSSSGADFVAMTAITETGSAATVQAVIEALVTRLKAVTDSASGADLIGATSISGVTGTTVQSLLEGLKTYADNLSMGAIIDGSITNAKLATDVKVGSLSDLDTTEKSSVVGAVNEVKGDLTTLTDDLSSYAEFNISANQSIADSAFATLVLDTTVKAKTSLFEIATGDDAGKIKVLKTGTYEVIAHALFAGATGGERAIKVLNNNRISSNAPNGTTAVTSMVVSLVDATADDVIEIDVYQNSGSALDVITLATHTWVQIKKVG